MILIGNPGGRRVELFQAALARKGRPPARLVAYADLLAGRAQLGEIARPGSVVRIESPGKDFPVERALLRFGAEAAAAERYDWIDGAAASKLEFDQGRIWPSRQWYLGLCAALQLIERQLAECPWHRLMNAPADIAAMFDKRECHQRITEAGIAAPRKIGPVESFEELVVAMGAERCRRVFVKLAHGSSASGVLAYQTNGARHQAITTVEVTRVGGELRLYNSRRLRTYQNLGEIAELIDALCRQRVHVEQWMPKAGYDGRTFDLRVVVIAGTARHTVARMSRGPMTNLHLLNQRGDAEAIRARMGERAWRGARQACERAMGCFPGSLYAGIDLLIAPGFQRHAVLEINAFGDLLPGALWQGQDTYASEIEMTPT